MKKLMLSMAVVMGLAACVGAASLPVANPSFEAQVLGDGAYIVDDVTGWVVEDAANHDVWTYNPGSETPDGKGSDGENVLMIWNDLGISQTLAGATTDNTHYRFSMDIFVSAYGGNTIYIAHGGTLVQSSDESWATGDAMVPIQLHGAGISNPRNTSPNGTGISNFTQDSVGGWHSLVLEWDIPAGSALDGEDITIYLRGHTGAGGGWTMMDNVSLVATPNSVPEPDISGFSKVPGSDFMEMVIDAGDGGSWPEFYYPEACADLVTGGWGDVMHSYTNDVATLAFTNLEYSAVDGTGTNKVIYLQTDNANKFFRIVADALTADGQDGTWVVDADGNWWDSANWLDDDVAFGAGKTASFAADITTNRAVSLNLPVMVGGLSFSDTAAPAYGWTLSGSQLTLSGSATPAIDFAGADDVAEITTAELIGNQGFDKTGSGTLYLSTTENINLTGGISVNAGTLKTGASNSTGSNNVTVASGAAVELVVPPSNNTGSTGDWTINGSGIGGGGALRYVSAGVAMALNYPLTLGSASTIGVDDSLATLVLQGSLSGSSGLTKVGDGQLRIIADNGSSYTGDTTISAGTVRMDHVNALGAFVDTAGGGTITVADGATLKWNYPAQESDKPLVINGSGVGAEGVLQLVREDGAGPRAIGWTGVEVATDSLVNVKGASCGMYLGGLTGSGDLTKIGVNKLDLERENETYAGAITIEEGALSIRHFSGALGQATAGTTLHDGAWLELVSDGHTSGGVNYDGHNYPEPFIFGGGIAGSGVDVIRYDSSGDAVTDELSGAITLATDVEISVIDALGASDDLLKISGAIGGAGDITIIGDVDGGGVIELTGNNTFAGNTTVNSGTLRLTGTNNKLPDTGTLTVASGATVDLGSGVSETVNSLVLNGVVQSAGTYNAANTPSYFSGAGDLIVTP